MLSSKISKLIINNYAGASCEEIEKDLQVILKDANKIEKLLIEVSVSIRNGGYDSKSSFGKIYNKIIKHIS